jgi:hypothetical protein
MILPVRRLKKILTERFGSVLSIVTGRGKSRKMTERFGRA